MWLISVFLVLVSLALDAVTTLPLILVVLLCLSIVFRSGFVFVLAFFAGLYLDIIFVRTLGQTSLFFLIFIFLLFLYERKFEIQSVQFVFFAGLLGSGAFLLMFGHDYIFWQAVVSSIFAVLLFRFLCHPELVSGSRSSRLEMPK